MRDIRLFVAAYEERSFTAAAKRGCTSQPVISQHIRKIEETLDTMLFLRLSKCIEPTPAADAYYQKCIEILRLHEDAVEEMKGYQGEVAGEIRIGLMQTLTRGVLAQTLAGFMEQNPNVRVRIYEAFGSELTRRVRAGELDFAIVPSFVSGVHEEGIKCRSFVVTPEFLISRRSDSQQTLTPIRLADMKSVRMLLPHPGDARRGRIEEFLRKNNIAVEQIFELDASHAWLGLVARTDWLAILPGLMVIAESDQPGISLAPIVDPPFMLELVRIESSSGAVPSGAETFYEHLQKETITVNERLLELVDA